MATIASNTPAKGVKEFVFEWEGKDRKGKQVRGEIRAAGENIVQARGAAYKDQKTCYTFRQSHQA